jgi:hypothetical protein
MQLQNLKLSRLMMYTESTSKENLEDLYFFCFGEYPVDELTIEDLQYNISYHLKDSPSEEIAKIFKNVF